MNPFSRLIDYIQAHRFGQTGITGLNELQNSGKMLALVCSPLLTLWIGLQYSVASGYITKEQGGGGLILLFFGWIMYFFILWSYVGKDASQYKCFPQATVFFPDGGARKFTLPIKQEGIFERCKWKDGSKGVEIEFLNRYMYQSKDADHPYLFDSMLLKIPAEVGETFRFNDSGEWWYKGMIVNTSSCENVSIYVYGWEKEEGKWKPVGIVADCYLNFMKALAKHLNPSDLTELKKAQRFYMLYKDARKKLKELRNDYAILEETHSVTLQKQGKGIRQRVDGVLEAVFDGVHTIDDMKEPLSKRIIKLGKVLVPIAIIVAVGFLAKWLGWF